MASAEAVDVPVRGCVEVQEAVDHGTALGNPIMDDIAALRREQS
jgi:hypothetical protein